jgi:hypothetical protein
MAKKKEERKVKNTNGSFELVGAINLGLDKFSAKTSDSGYKYQRFSSSINCGSTKPRIQAMGGFFPNNPYPISYYDNGAKCEIDWVDRLNEKIVKEVPNYNRITLGVTRDESGAIVYKDFLSWFDAMAELQKLQDGSVVKVKGDVKYQIYEKDGKETTNYQLEVNKIYLCDAEEEDFHATFKQVVLFDEDSIDKARYKEDKEIDIFGTVIQYDSTIKVSRPMPFKYVVALEDFKSPDQFKKMLALMKVKTGVLGFEVLGDIHAETSVRQATVEDFSADLLDFYEDDVDTLLEEKIIDNSAGGNFLSITKPAMRVNKKTTKKELFREAKDWLPEDLIFQGKKEETVEDIDDLIDGELNLDDLDLDLDLDLD